MKKNQFAKDHWSVFCYAETRAVDYRGQLDRLHMRTDGDRYPTKTKAGVIPGHSDLDCIEDLEEAGLLVNTGTGLFPKIELTDEGWLVASSLRRWKASGGSFASFEVSR